MSFFERNRASLRERGYDPDRLPPGQYFTERYPVLHVGDVPKIDPQTWDLSVFGLVRAPRHFSLAELQALPRTTIVTDIHCVTKWSKFDMPWEGVRVRDVLALCDPDPLGQFVVEHAEFGYTTNLPLADVTDGTAWIAFNYDGAPLAPEHGGPARLLVPHLYFWKSAKWVRGLRLVPRDEPGFWEELGYHDRGDPWREQRYRGDP
jgi:DMSO/TMAO reductase YedYZ molybdopterin-dependent catalytic subunit